MRVWGLQGARRAPVTARRSGAPGTPGTQCPLPLAVTQHHSTPQPAQHHHLPHNAPGCYSLGGPRGLGGQRRARARRAPLPNPPPNPPQLNHHHTRLQPTRPPRIIYWIDRLRTQRAPGPYRAPTDTVKTPFSHSSAAAPQNSRARHPAGHSHGPLTHDPAPEDFRCHRERRSPLAWPRPRPRRPDRWRHRGPLLLLHPTKQTNTPPPFCHTTPAAMATR